MAVIWKKKYGQHLLHDKNITRKIVSSINTNDDEYIIEIGPGTGAITELLVEKNTQVKSVEIDHQFFEILEEKFADKENFELVKGDFLKTDIENLFITGKKAVIVGNLPYNITSQILFRLFEYIDDISAMYFTIQREAALRICGKVNTKDWGILAINSQFYTEPKILFNISKNSFFPPPKVDSSVIQMIVKNKRDGIDENDFRIVVKTAFGKRRKTLRNNFSEIEQFSEEAFEDKVDFGKRPEEFTLEEYIEFTRVIFE